MFMMTNMFIVLLTFYVVFIIKILYSSTALNYATNFFLKIFL